MVLDASKTGLILLQGIQDKDARKHSQGDLVYKSRLQSKLEKTPKLKYSNEAPLTRKAGLKPFIMDFLSMAAIDAFDKQLGRVEDEFRTRVLVQDDADLCKPWKDVDELYRRHGRRDELGKIEDHVKRMYAKHKERIDSAFSEKPIEVRQNILRTASQEFNAGPKPDDVIMTETAIVELRASYAYVYDREQQPFRWGRFPWDVAFRELCEIKLRNRPTTEGRAVPMGSEFFNRLYMKMK